MSLLYAHQVSGIAWLASKQRALLGDVMGLGKSITTIVAAQRAGAKRILVLAPTVVAWNWAREFSRWAPELGTTLILAGSEVRKINEAPVVITTHGLLIRGQVFDALCAQDWDLVVLDEAHYFRSAEAKRTRAFYGGNGVVRRAARVWLLTGTPMPNHAAELWPMLRGLWPERCTLDYEAFREKFCVLQWSELRGDYKVVGNRNLPELKSMLEGLFLRRTKEQCLKDLPPMRWETLVLRPERLPEELVHLDESIPEGDIEATLQWLRDNEQFSRWRRLCGLAKAESAVELLAEELENGELQKVVVTAHHLDVLKRLELGLKAYGAVTITGSVAAEDRQRAVDRFQTDPSCRVVLCQLQAGSVGITLTAANEVVFVEQSFVPGDNAQLADRCHRIGQKQQVRSRFLSLAGTVDELVSEALARKTEMIREVLGGKS